MSKLTDRLAAVLGIFNEHQFLTAARPEVSIKYTTGPDGPLGYTDRCATVRFTRDGKPMKAEFRDEAIRSGVEARKTLVARAQAAAGQHFGVTKWVRLPWPDSWTWIPEDAYQRVMTALESAEQTTQQGEPHGRQD